MLVRAFLPDKPHTMKMKRFLLTSVFIFLAFGVALAQAPQQFNYQGAARNANGSPLANKQISLRISILDGSATGSSQYAETRNVTTNLLGLYTVIIGSSGATTVTGSMAAVTWQSGLKFIKVEVDPNNGNNFSVAGTAQLLSVPYALYAGNGGVAGPQGAAGRGIVSAISGIDGTLKITYTDGTSYTTPSLTGPQGPIGATGAPGKGIASTVTNPDGTITIKFTDNSTYTSTSFMGTQGPAGADGKSFTSGTGTPTVPGKNGDTYVNTTTGETYVYNNNTWTSTGTSLKGDKGDVGVVGVQGMPGTSGTPGIPGSGTAGAPGSGVTIVTNDTGTWVYNPTTNTWTNIIGPKGDKGDVGVVGVQGMPGTSGTPGIPGSGTAGAPGSGVTIVTNDTGTWVYNPTTNTWTNIIGPKGDAGVVGVQGMPGTSGTPGIPGSGTAGAPGSGVTIVTNDNGTWVYNPTTNTWTNIIGPKGDKGDAGVVGVQGMPGTSGTPGIPGSGTAGAPGSGVTIVTNDTGTWVYNPTTNTWTNIIGPKGDKGDAGVVGVQGMPGTSGTPGTPGSGTAGAPGSGVTIVTNDTGTWVYNPTTNTWTNIIGPKGDKGDVGVVGVQGMPGTSGAPGTPGSGTAGAPGSGVTIVTNDTGTWVYNPTTNTWTNIIGPKGDKGDAGVVGVQGMPGTSGAPGTPGSGTAGAPGSGVTIVTNDTGTWVYNPTTNTWTNIIGPKGDKGDAGVVGVQGMPGTSGTPGIPGSGTAGAPGSGVTIVTNDTGTWVYNPTTNTWTNIIGPKGDKGDAGLVGAPGPAGAQGGIGLIENGTNTTVTGTGVTGDAYKINTTIISTDAGNLVTAGADGGAKLLATNLPVITADNGLTKTANNIQLGGVLLPNTTTTITTGLTNKLAIAGLQTGLATDSIVVASTGGVLKTIAQSSLQSEPWYKVGTTVGATQNTDDIFIMGSKVGIGTITPNYQLDVNGMFNQSATLTDGRVNKIHSGDNAAGFGIKGASITSQLTGGPLSYIMAGDASSTGGASNQTAIGLTDIAAGNNVTFTAIKNNGTGLYGATVGVFDNTSQIHTDWGAGQISSIVNDGTNSNNFNVFSTYLQSSQYPNTRNDNSGATPVVPTNFLYTDINGKFLSAPTSVLAADLRMVGTNNHITQDAGVGSNGSSAGTGTSNLLLGLNSGSSLTAGSGNIALGRDALSSNNVGDYNVAIGVNSLRSNTATQNVGVGVGSLQQTTTGGYNVAMGNQSLSGNKIGVSNTAIGSFALQSNVGGNANVGLGRNSLDGNISGSNNVAIGNVAGSTLTSGDRNIFIGQNVQPNISTTSSNQLNIGNWIYGDNGKIGIGSAAIIPSERMDIANGNLRVRDINSVSGAVTDNIVVADATGVLKTVAPSTLALEPWFKATTVSPATQNTDNIYQMGNVGINTLVPTDKLHIHATNNSGIMVQGNSQDTTHINFTEIANNGQGQLNWIRTINTLAASIRTVGSGSLAIKGLGFFAGTDAAGADGDALERMRINEQGNVGINTIAPSNKLHVKATANPVRFEGLQTGLATDSIVVASTGGVLKTIAASTLSNTNIVKTAVSHTVVANDYTILANTTTAGLTITLPAATGNTGRILVIRKTDETANVLTFNLPVKISETTSVTSLNVNSTIRIQSDGTDWYKID
jgi:outer membrane lipoprotein-sorting protein